MRKKGSYAELERIRMTAANMFEAGMDNADVARATGADAQSVRRWRRAFDAGGGREALRSKGHPGRPPRLTTAQREALAAMLVRSPAEVGFGGRHLWTCELVADLIAREFGGVRYHHDYVGTLLHAIGFSHQKPARRAAERDEARVEAWRRDAWPALLKKPPTPAG